jgi:hypothetical protein
MADLLRPDAFEITAFEGRELVETPGLAATLDVKAASVLSDQQLVAFGSASCSSMLPSTRHRASALLHPDRTHEDRLRKTKIGLSVYTPITACLRLRRL